MRALVRPGSPRFHLDGLDLRVRGRRHARSARCAPRWPACDTFSTSPPTTGCGRAIRAKSMPPMSDGTRTMMQEATARRRRAHRLYLAAWRHSRCARTAPRPTRPSRFRPRTRDRRLQAEQDRRRAAGRGHGRQRRPAGGDRQSLDADRSARRQADADRPHHRRGRARTHARPSSIPASISSMSTMSPRAISRRCSAAGSASAIFSAARMCCSATCSPTSRARRAASRRAGAFRAPPLYPVAYAAETVARFTGREPFATRDGIRMAEHHMFFTAAKAERELGFHGAAVPGGARGRDPLVPARRDIWTEARAPP